MDGAFVAPQHQLLPPTATVIAELPNKFGPDFIAVHFDLSAMDGPRRSSYVTKSQIQAANDIVQRYAQEEHYPLLIFTLPGNSGMQFVTGELTPGDHYQTNGHTPRFREVELR